MANDSPTLLNRVIAPRGHVRPKLDGAKWSVDLLMDRACEGDELNNGRSTYCDLMNRLALAPTLPYECPLAGRVVNARSLLQLQHSFRFVSVQCVASTS